MRPDDAQPATTAATTAQWLEHSESWRYAHLDLAPSETLRRMAIQEHERLLHPVPGTGHTPHRILGRFPKRNRRS